ncbi:MAG: hypothetical protein Q4D96_01550 [Propionibacteriaceae bacterium]|nr:hypothetical protein [Propionibacteriaceae bacterium]
MMMSVSLLETLPAGIIWVAIFATVIGLLGLWQGWMAYTEPTPRFVLHYTGWSCPPLAILYGGLGMLSIGVAVPITKLKEVQATIPEAILGVFGVTSLFCIATFLLGFFFWFPPFLIPRWYWRARKAGIPRHDPQAMGEFKALPLEQQKAAARKRRRR